MHDDVDCAHHNSQGAFLLILNGNMDAQMEAILSSVDQTKASTHLSNAMILASGVVDIKICRCWIFVTSNSTISCETQFYLHAHLVPRNWTSLLKHHWQKLEKKKKDISQWFCLGGVSSFSPRCRLNRRGEPQIPCSKKKTHWIIVCKNNCFFVCASNQRYMGWYGAPTGGAAKGSAQNESKVMGASS